MFLRMVSEYMYELGPVFKNPFQKRKKKKKKKKKKNLFLQNFGNFKVTNTCVWLNCVV